MPEDAANLGTRLVIPSPRQVFGLTFASETQKEMLAELTGDPGQMKGARLLVTANVDHIVTLRHDPAFREAYANAWRVTADGTPVYLYAKLRGGSVKERVTGSDLFADMCAAVRPGDHRLFLLVGTSPTADKIRAYFSARGFDADAVNVEVPPFGFERDEEYSRALAQRIERNRTTHLVMGVGAPKSEIWADQRRDLLGNVFVLCVGASVEFFVGEKARAPAWVSKLGLEWLHRFLSEPRRLYHRYFVRSWGFLAAVAQDLKNA